MWHVAVVVETDGSWDVIETFDTRDEAEKYAEEKGSFGFYVLDANMQNVDA